MMLTTKIRSFRSKIRAKISCTNLCTIPFPSLAFVQEVTQITTLTREEKLSQMCQETPDCERIKLFGKEIVYSDKRTVYDLFRLCSSVYLAKAVQ